MDGKLAPVVVITGGSSGIGRCTAGLFARRGWRVGLIARGAEGLAAAKADVEQAGALAAVAQADVTDSAALQAAADALVEALGPIDIWINCAGNGVYGRFWDVPEAEFDRVTDVTYRGAVNGTRIALAHMRPRGRGGVVNVCSAIAFYGMPLLSSYAGAKAAVRAFGQSLRGELRMERSAIRLSTVFPPAVNTPFFSHAKSHMGWPSRPARPVYQPEVVAEGLWLAAISGRPELTISGVANIFLLATRLTPGLIAWCMQRLGVDGQMTQDEDAVQLERSTLFAPSERVIGVRGPFSRGARGWSSQLWLLRLRILAGRALKGGRAPRKGAPSPSRPAPPPGRPGPDGSGGPDGAS